MWYLKPTKLICHDHAIIFQKYFQQFWLESNTSIFLIRDGQNMLKPVIPYELHARYLIKHMTAWTTLVPLICTKILPVTGRSSRTTTVLHWFLHHLCKKREMKMVKHTWTITLISVASYYDWIMCNTQTSPVLHVCKIFKQHWSHYFNFLMKSR